MLNKRNVSSVTWSFSLLVVFVTSVEGIGGACDSHGAWFWLVSYSILNSRPLKSLTACCYGHSSSIRLLSYQSRERRLGKFGRINNVPSFVSLERCHSTRKTVEDYNHFFSNIPFNFIQMNVNDSGKVARSLMFTLLSVRLQPSNLTDYFISKINQIIPKSIFCVKWLDSFTKWPCNKRDHVQWAGQ